MSTTESLKQTPEASRPKDKILGFGRDVLRAAGVVYRAASATANAISGAVDYPFQATELLWRTAQLSKAERVLRQQTSGPNGLQTQAALNRAEAKIRDARAGQAAEAGQNVRAWWHSRRADTAIRSAQVAEANLEQLRAERDQSGNKWADTQNRMTQTEDSIRHGFARVMNPDAPVPDSLQPAETVQRSDTTR